MSFVRWGTESREARLLRKARPEAPDGLVRRLAASTTPLRRSGRAPRFALAGVATVAMLAGLAAVGGASYAASEIVHIVQVATGHTNYFGKRLAIEVAKSSPAADQYGGVTVSNQAVSAVVEPSATSPTVVSVATPGPTGTSIDVQVAPGTFTTPVAIHVDPAPPAVTQSATLVGGGNQIVSIVVTDTSGGTAIHSLPTPLSVVFKNPPKGFVPVVSTDGVNFRALTNISPATTLTADQQDGYYIAGDGSIVILTRHLTLFAVLYSANVNVSESGRKTPPAGSGQFGDPTRNHVGAPKLTQVGGKITPTAGRVPFTFHVDEQASVYISIYDAKGNPVWIRRNGTSVRSHPYSGTPVMAFHVVILRPGYIKTLLNTVGLQAGQTYKLRITAVDFDGHKVTAYTTFTA